MGNLASKAGWVIFILALIGNVFHTGPDDPITAGMKSSGLYRPFLIVVWIVICLALIRMAFILKASAAMRRQLDGLRNRKGR